MAARKALLHSPLTRERIKTGMLVKRLEDLSEGKIEMPPHAVTAALGLLRKVLPDLAATTISGDKKNPLVVQGYDDLSTTTLREIAALRLSSPEPVDDDLEPVDAG